jgi:hypothetical protein
MGAIDFAGGTWIGATLSTFKVCNIPKLIATGASANEGKPGEQILYSTSEFSEVISE